MLEKMKEIIAEQLNCDAESITPETSFKEDLGADSLDLFELVMALEDEYSVEIPSVRGITGSDNSRRSNRLSESKRRRRIKFKTRWEAATACFLFF